MPLQPELKDAIQTLCAYAGRLSQYKFPKPLVDRLADLSAIITYRELSGAGRPPVIGLIGCTGVGKSTLFNSLCEKPLSATGWRVHNTRGPVLFIPPAALASLEKWEAGGKPLFMPLLPRVDTASHTEGEATFGVPGMLHIIPASETASAPDAFCFIDLPDINSSPSVEEQLMALEAMPWLDIVIFMVDDETVYHRVYTRPVEMADKYKQSRFCIMINRGRDRIDPDHRDWQQTKDFFGVPSIHLFPDLMQKTDYGEDPVFAGFKKTLATCQDTAPSGPLTERIAELSDTICRENRRRQQQVDRLDGTVADSVRDLLARDMPLSLNQLLPDETLHALNHLGLTRFSLSNLLFFFKNLASSANIKRSLKLSFGSHRDQALDRLLHVDRSKLIRIVSHRIGEYSQHLVSAIRRSSSFELIKQVDAAANPSAAASETGDPPPFTDSLKAIADQFENRCRSLLKSDSVNRVIQNDPVAALFLAGALAADVFVLPGFGSWLLLPTVIKYLPLGKFEKAKKTFQKDVQEVIRGELHQLASQYQDLRIRAVLGRDDPLLKALETCRRNYSDPAAKNQ